MRMSVLLLLATCLICFPLIGQAAEDVEPAVVTMDGSYIRINGVGDIPVGMFGVHNTPLTDERIHEWGVASERAIVQRPSSTPRTPGSGIHEDLKHYIECFWDRYHPPLQLMNPGSWREQLRSLGQGYGENSRNTGFQHRVEFWNEPYLNWAARPGVSWDPKFYKRDGIAEGDRVYIRGQDEPTEHLIWRQGHFLERAKDNRPNDIMDYVRGGNFFRDPFSDSMMRGAQFGEPFEFQGRHLVAKPKLVPYDPTQWERKSANNRWWSGQQNRIWYQQMLIEFGEALKAANPDVQLAAGWGFHFSQGGWSAWRELYEPVLDAAIHVVDAVHEHHYGGDTRMVAANYEVVWNWAMAKHGKALEFWNTEAGGQLDPQRPDVVHADSRGGPMERARGAATYNIRDTLYLLMWSPDRATARAAHHAHHNGGDEFAFRLMRQLRGRLVHSVASDRDLWSVASRSDQHINILLFNDLEVPRETTIVANSPSDAPWAEDRVFIETIIEADDGKGLAIQSEVSQVDNGERWEMTLTIPAKSAVSLTRPVAKVVSAHHSIEQQLRHFPANDILRWVNPDKPLELTVEIPDAQALAELSAANIRIAMINYFSEDEQAEPFARFAVNGHQQPLEFGNWLHRQSIDPSHLKVGTNQLSFETSAGGFGIWAAAIETVTVEETHVQP